MRVVCDIETDSYDPTQIWVIVCYDIDAGDYHVFRNVTQDYAERERYLSWASGVDTWVGHNFLGFDYPVLNRLAGLVVEDIADHAIDTYIISKLVDYPREGHGLESYGEEFGIPKGLLVDDSSVISSTSFNKEFFKYYSQDLESYCKRDVDITYRIYKKYIRVLNDPDWSNSISLENNFQYYVINSLEDNGFAFNTKKAEGLLKKVEEELKVLDAAILKEFPPKSKLIREITPKTTKHGTISKSSIPKKLRDFLDGDLSVFTEDAPFSFVSFQEFNPASHKQLIDVLTDAGWDPIDKTKARLELEREINRLKYQRNSETKVDLSSYSDKLVQSEKYGWKINELNLSTLPDSAPSPARTLAKRILLESRRRTLTEWLGLVAPSGRIHGKFYGIGAWTHRMAHQSPNTANIPNEFDTFGQVKLLGKEMRQLWQAPKNRLLVGVDAEGIQLRIFAHYIDDPEFTDALVKGKKDDKSDPHSLNQRILGEVCKSRAAAKRFIYALLLGAGLGKLSEILGCGREETEAALSRLLKRYEGFALLKQSVIPSDAKRGYFIGLDGRKVRIPGDTTGTRKHLCMSGYLQNGEAVVMKKASLVFHPKLKELDSKLVNFVHDEWQTETPNNMEIALQVAKLQADSLRIVGEELGLKCPLAGSYYNDDHKDYTIGTNWYQTH